MQKTTTLVLLLAAANAAYASESVDRLAAMLPPGVNDSEAVIGASDCATLDAGGSPSQIQHKTQWLHGQIYEWIEKYYGGEFCIELLEPELISLNAQEAAALRLSSAGVSVLFATPMEGHVVQIAEDNTSDPPLTSEQVLAAMREYGDIPYESRPTEPREQQGLDFESSD